jgi:coenzyme PQQ synthesis protein D (PqqD)
MSNPGTETNPSVVLHDHVVFTELDGTEGVLVDLNDKNYYRLNKTAMLVWRSLEKQMPREEIAREFTAHYDVTTEHALSSIERIIGEFESDGLLTTN